MDERLGAVLPYLRPRSQEFSWFFLIGPILLLALIAGGIIASYLRSRRQQRHTWEVFHTTALERGLNPSQVQLLAQIARRKRMKNPLLLLSSLKTFDQYVGEWSSRLMGVQSDSSDFSLETLSHIRTLLGFDRLKAGQTLQTTREIQPGTTLMVRPEGRAPGSFAHCVVIRRDERAIAAVPLLRSDDHYLAQLEPGEPVQVRFWQTGEGEYHFCTQILKALPQATALLLKHADHLERIERRDFFRIEVDFGLVLFCVPREEGSPPGPSVLDLKNARRLQGQVLNLSGGGFSLLTAEAIPIPSWLVIDPDFQGAFSLAGQVCEVLEQERQPQGVILRLQFFGLTPEHQDEIVGQVHRYQIRTGLDQKLT